METDNMLKRKQRKTSSGVLRLRPLVCLFFILHFSFVFSSCIDDDFNTDGSFPEGQSRVVLTMNLPAGMPLGDDTQNPEQQVTDVWIMAFDNADDSFLYIEEAQEIEKTTNGFKITVQLKKGLQDLYILAGAKTDLLTLFPTGIAGDGTETKSTIQQKLLISRSGVWDLSSPVPMWGSCTVDIEQDNTDLSGSPVPLLRMLAKITVHKEATIPDTDFTLTKIHLCNYQEKGYMIPLATNWDGTLVTAPTVNSPIVTTPYLEFPATDVLYTFEAVAGTRTGYVKNTLLVIEGYYKGNTSKSFYRIDFIKEGETNYCPLLRNHHYKVLINDVTGPGQPSVEEAIKALPIDVKAGILVWEEGYNHDEDLGEQNDFTLSQSLFVYPGWIDRQGTPSTGTIEVQSTADWSYQVSTSPSAVEGNVTSWFAATRQANTIHFTLQENPGEMREVYIHFKTKNLTRIATVQQRKGSYPNSYILPINGTLNLPVYKAYLVWADDVMGDRKQTLIGNVTYELIWQDQPDLVTVGYAPGSNAATGDKTVLQVTARNNMSGNALIGVKVNNIRRYSWHIWITDYNPDTDSNGSTLLYNNGYQDYRFMDRNLGATTTTIAQLTTHGFLYQWGRKDPFPGPPAIFLNSGGTSGSNHKFLYNASNAIMIIQDEEAPATSPSVNSNNIYYSLQHPDCYLGSRGESDDWYNEHEDYLNDYLWSDPNGQKGLFDPCPDGWRVPDWIRDAEGVPKYSPWRNWTDRNCQYEIYGRSFDGCYFPRPGTLSSSYSSSFYFINIGSYGSYWTASPLPETAYFWPRVYHLHLSVGSAQSTTTTNRSAALSVRCVQE